MYNLHDIYIYMYKSERNTGLSSLTRYLPEEIKQSTKTNSHKDALETLFH